jgi:hypothetical protein
MAYIFWNFGCYCFHRLWYVCARARDCIVAIRLAILYIYFMYENQWLSQEAIGVWV